jgi:hypothetical protein
MMKLKTILLGAALTGVTLIASSNLVQAQVCPRPTGVVAPSKQTRLIRNDRLNYRFQIPGNYKSMAVNTNRTLILDPKRFEEAQCLVGSSPTWGTSGRLKPLPELANRQSRRNLHDYIR